jgi:large subunit ribosomal protein L33
VGELAPFDRKNAPGMAGCLAVTMGVLTHGFRSRSVMAKSKKKVEVVFLVCDETGDYNYVLRRKPGGEKLKVKKYCPRLRRHTMHTEKKK